MKVYWRKLVSDLKMLLLIAWGPIVGGYIGFRIAPIGFGTALSLTGAGLGLMMETCVYAAVLRYTDIGVDGQSDSDESWSESDEKPALEAESDEV